MNQTPTAAQQLALDITPEYKPLMQEVGNTLWQLAEVGLQEYRSAAYLMQLFREQGFVVTGGLAGFPTGFMAEYKTGAGPVVALLCEYDALGALSTVKPGENGHGCGHNLFGAAATATAMVLRDVMKAQGLSGTLRVYGTPGEENYAGKAYYVNHGLFDDVDCSVGFHAHDSNQVNYTVSSGTLIKNYTFHGKPAHAGNCPWEGVSALDAVEIMNVACNYLREHVKPEARIHYIITHGGDVTNVVPDLAASQYSVRAASVPYMEELGSRVDRCAQAAALATGCTVEIEFVDRTYNTVLLRAYAELAQHWLTQVGPPEFSPAELADSKAFGDGSGLCTAIDPLPATELVHGGASDEGDVSWVVPHVSIYVANLAKNTNGHTLDFTRQCNMPAAYTAMVTQVKATAAMLLELMQSPEELDALRQAHKAKLGGLSYPKNPDYTLPPKFNPNCAGVQATADSLTVNFEELVLLPRGFSGTVTAEKDGEVLAECTHSGTSPLEKPIQKGESLHLYANGVQRQLIGYWTL